MTTAIAALSDAYVEDYARLNPINATFDGVAGYDHASWIGIVAPAGTPDEVVGRLSAELTKVLRSPETVKKLADNGIDPMVMTPAQMRDYMASDSQRMAKVVKDAGMDRE